MLWILNPPLITFHSFVNGPNIVYNIWNDEDWRRGQRRMYRMVGAGTSPLWHRGSLQYVKLSTGSTMPPMLLSHKKFARFFRRTTSPVKTCSFQCHNAAIPAVNVRRSSMHSSVFLGIAIPCLSYRRRAGVHITLHERTQTKADWTLLDPKKIKLGNDYIDISTARQFWAINLIWAAA